MDRRYLYSPCAFPCKWMFLLFSCFIAGVASAQNVAINTDGSRANPNAMLDIQSSSKGLLIPRMSSEARQRIAPTQGLLVYDINTNSFWYNTGRQWLNISTTSVSMSASGAWLLTGNAGTVDGINFLGTTDNVPLSIRVNNQLSGRIDHITGNTFWGYRSGMNITTGNHNTGTGTEALHNNMIGNKNVAIGFQSLYNNFIGHFNVAMGHQSLFNNTTGESNTALGMASMFANKSGSGNVATGYRSLSNNTIGIYNTGVGYDAMLSNISGSFNTAVGMQALRDNTGGGHNTALGSFALQGNTIGTFNIAVGVEAMASSDFGLENTATGYRALYSNRGSRNTAFGAHSLFSNASGHFNTAAGYNALRNNTSGDWNTALGESALYTNTSGYWNSSSGGASLYFNRSGFVNTANGFLALYQNTTGSHNVALGYLAGGRNTTGVGNTAIGTYSDFSDENFDNATALGYFAIADASNKVRIGASFVTVIEGQVPFTTPSDGRYKFDVQEDVRGLDFILQLRPVTYQFDVKRFDERLAPSNQRLPGTIKPLQDEKITAMVENGYAVASSIRRTGFIAQEVEQAAKRSGYNFSGLITPGKEQQYYSLSYESFVVPLVKAVQEQQQVITDQQKHMQEQDKKITELQRKLDEVLKLIMK